MLFVIREIAKRPPEAKAVHLHLGPLVPIIDHTTCDTLHHMMDDYNSNDEQPKLVIDGWDNVRPLSRHERGMRVALDARGSFMATAQAEEDVEIAQATD